MAAERQSWHRACWPEAAEVRGGLEWTGRDDDAAVGRREMIWAGVFLIVGLTAIWLWLSARHIVRVSEGPRIAPRPGTALVLVDLQGAYWTDRCHDVAARQRVEAAVSREVTLARHRDQPVIALRQEWRGPGTRLVACLLHHDPLCRGDGSRELAPPFHGMADHVVIKHAEDGFATGELDSLLEVLRVGRLRVAGRDGARTVARTAQAALNRGYEVDLVPDAIATTEPGRFEAVKDALRSQGARAT
jgi:nicotinamidase-related amidase